MIETIESMIEHHLQRADDLEDYARKWWRVSRYAWEAAAAVHRHTATELRLILNGYPETGLDMGGRSGTRWGARRAAKRALKFWSNLGYNVTYEGTQH